MIKAYWHKSKNVGDTLTPVILKFFLNQEIELAPRNSRGKLLAVGSVMNALREWDAVWGTGLISNKAIRQPKNNKFLAVRGKLTKELLGINCSTFGDPGLLMPLIYNPNYTPIYNIGYIPHYVDQDKFEGKEFINVLKPWKEVIDEILKCKKIVSSSLHGIVLAEAYGIPAKWEVYSNKVIGDGFKFRDYLSGTGRTEKDVDKEGYFLPIKDLPDIQNRLIRVLKQYYDDI